MSLQGRSKKWDFKKVVIPKAILIDFDGTIINSEDPIIDTILFCFKKSVGIKVDRMQITKMFGLPIDFMFQKLAEDKFSQNNLDSFIKCYEKMYTEIITRSNLRPGALNFLKEAKKKLIKIILITNERSKNVIFSLKYFDIESFFNATVVREEVSNFKPSPQPLLLGIRKVKESVKDCIYIGESPYDIEAGKAAGMFTVALVTDLWPKEILTKNKPDVILENFREVCDLFVKKN